MKGIIKSIDYYDQGQQKITSVVIEDDEGIEYFAHIGDFKANEDLVYQNSVVSVVEGDEVDFEPFDNTRSRATKVVKKP